MAKDRGDEASEMVRYTGLMTRDDRARFRAFCVRTGQEMEEVGPRWILERLAEEERKLLDPRLGQRGKR